MINSEIILAYALKNAVEHGGNAKVGSVLNGLFNHGLEKDKINEVMGDVNDIMGRVNAMTNEEQIVLFEKHKDLVGHREVREGLRELENVSKSGVVMRFAPSASGPMHIGHGISASSSYIYFKKYGGKFYVRIEDTNPEASFKEAYKLLKEDSKWLFDGDAEIVIQSERMDLYYKYAEKLIKKDVSYVCSCDGDKFREYSGKKKNCPCRKLSVKENLERWKKMLALGVYPDKSSSKISTEGNKKGYKSGEAVLRFKSEMSHKNPALRDFPLARINEESHPLQGKKYRVWPLMNLSVSVDDIEMRMTHIIRGKDHRDNAEKQKMIYEALGKKFPEVYFLGIIHFKDLELSTSKMREMIKEGFYSGWDDEKLPTLLSLRKRGYKASAFWKFAEQIGLNEIDKNMDRKEFFTLLDGFGK